VIERLRLRVQVYELQWLNTWAGSDSQGLHTLRELKRISAFAMRVENMALKFLPYFPLMCSENAAATSAAVVSSPKSGKDVILAEFSRKQRQVKGGNKEFSR
jgi:hypothetical protein